MKPKEELSARRENPSYNDERGKSFYPERVSGDVDDLVERLEAIESDGCKLNLDQEKLDNILSLEEKLGERIEDICKIRLRSGLFSVEYFLTEEGRKRFFDLTGRKINSDNINDLSREIFNNRNIIASSNSKRRADLAGLSKKFENERVMNDLLKNLGEKGEVSLSGVEMPKRLAIIYNPEDALEKVQKIRKLKKEIKRLRKENTGDEAEKKVRGGILDIYARRLNEILVFTRNSILSIGKNAELNLTPVEDELLKQFAGIKKGGDRNIARMDKFIQGVDGENYDDFGNRTQVTAEIKEFAQTITSENVENELNKKDNISKKGLSEKKIFENNISRDEFVSFAKETLAHYGLLSSEDIDSYSSDREGSAEDGKWQFIADKKYRLMDVLDNQKIIRSGIENKNVFEALAILIAHEIEGHVLQHENKSKIPLRLFREVGADRESTFNEGATMLNQNKASKEMFGFKSLPHVHYLVAMQRKLEGGNYLECVQAFYESAMKIPSIRANLGQLDEDQYQRSVEKNLKLAVNRTERLFRGRSDYESKEGILTRSKDLVYIEQEIFMRKLKSKGLEKYSFIGGVNLRTIVFLAENGFIDPKKIKVPDGYYLKIWDRIKDRYRR